MDDHAPVVKLNMKKRPRTATIATPKWAQAYQTEIAQSLRFPPVLLQIVYAYFNKFTSRFAPYQQLAFDHCVAGHNTFITGPAGAGKTFLLSSIVKHLRRTEKNVIVTASTGKAAVMIKGQTLHSFSKLMQIKQRGSFPDLSIQFERDYWMETWQDVDVLVIDEISMITPNDFQLLVRLWRELRIQLQLIVLGDFFQLPPVITEESKFRYCFETPEWRETITHTAYLYDVFRQSDQAFVRTLNAIRLGRFTALDVERIQRRWIRHPSYTNARPVTTFKDDYTWMFATNHEANEHNRGILDTIKGETHIYRSMFGYAQRSRYNNQHQMAFLFDFYNEEDAPEPKRHYFTDAKYRDAFSVEQMLQLKVGVRVMLTVNLNVMHGLVNGSCGVITGFAVPDHIPEYKNVPFPIVRFDNGVVNHIVMHEWQMTTERTTRNEIGAYLWMAQLPLRYAYAMTAHKAQGMTMKQGVVVSLKKLFVNAQAYTCISRVETLEALHLLDPIDASMFRPDARVQRFYETIM